MEIYFHQIVYMTITIEYGYKNYEKQKANIQIWDTDENEITWAKLSTDV